MGEILSILIPSTYDRDVVLRELVAHLNMQIHKLDEKNIVEILIELDNKEISIGLKRQLLIQKAKGIYVVHIDSDDWVSDDYIHDVLLAIKENPDVVGFSGWMTHSGERRENFKISKDLPYVTIKDEYGYNEYLRFNNHLSPIKRDIALQIGFRDYSMGEDYDYALRLKESGLIKKEVFVEKYLYHYRYVKYK